MIRVNESELFPIVVSLLDETTGALGTGKTVYYDIRDINDNFLSPPISGILPESIIEAGIYRTTESIPTTGRYVIYCTCSGFVSNTEEVIVNEENIYDLTKQNRHHNISVEDVPRTNSTPTASQVTRKVPMNKTDYIITRIKGDSDSDWSITTTGGILFAWYRSITDELPFRMGGES